MGLGASQAKLLSITSRMSDNELRAQLINNSKMRLASDSSKVSEDYVTALNQSRMMFTNYGPENTKAYQDLTFNSMTAFNQYNNQYGLSTIAGQLLVSETDANKFKAAQTSSDPLNTFLASYDLEYNTTFFNDEQLGKYMDNGKLKLGKHVAPDGTETQLYSKFKPEDYKTMYFGDVKYDDKGNVVSGTHLGYDASFLSKTYIDYELAIKNYNESYTQFKDALPLREFLETFKSNENNTLGGIYSAVCGGIEPNAANLPTLESYLDQTISILGNVKSFGLADDDGKSSYYENLIKNMQNFKEGTTESKVETDGNKLNIDNTGDPNVPFLQITKDAIGGLTAKFVTKDANGNYHDVPLANDKTPILDSEGKPFKDDEGNDLNWTYREELTKSIGNPNEFVYTYYAYDADGNEIPEEKYTEKYTVVDFGSAGKDPEVTIKAEQSAKDGDTRASEIYNYLSQTLTSYFATYKEQFDFYKVADYVNNQPDDKISQAQKNKVNNAKIAYEEHAKTLAKVIFGDVNGNNINYKDYQNLIDLDWVEEHVPPYQDSFQSVIDITNLEELFNVYGEPTFSWQKEGEPDKNAEAEAKWYTNLYKRMEDGYKVLENGLASSKEWMQFALESGLVSMQQVDKKGNWVSTMYSNCSDITEQTDNLAVTRAEAKYKQDMNKIENKDKRFDMELKNIDTEHTSLQTEYDSIKTVIDKNIERSFKMYS